MLTLNKSCVEDWILIYYCCIKLITCMLYALELIMNIGQTFPLATYIFLYGIIIIFIFIIVVKLVISQKCPLLCKKI